METTTTTTSQPAATLQPISIIHRLNSRRTTAPQGIVKLMLRLPIPSQRYGILGT